jgi:hypothetical protein
LRLLQLFEIGGGMNVLRGVFAAGVLLDLLDEPRSLPVFLFELIDRRLEVKLRGRLDKDLRLLDLDEERIELRLEPLGSGRQRLLALRLHFGWRRGRRGRRPTDLRVERPLRTSSVKHF